MCLPQLRFSSEVITKSVLKRQRILSIFLCAFYFFMCFVFLWAATWEKKNYLLTCTSNEDSNHSLCCPYEEDLHPWLSNRRFLCRVSSFFIQVQVEISLRSHTGWFNGPLCLVMTYFSCLLSVSVYSANCVSVFVNCFWFLLQLSYLSIKNGPIC